MSDNRPIGIFDSGVGGLTVLSALSARLPNESTLYVGDTARVPYGNKGAETITRYAMEICAFLTASNVKCIVIACNTVSALSLDALQSSFSVPIIGVIDPCVKRALEVTRDGNMGIIGTRSTIASHAYQRKLRSCNVVSAACPLFVPLVEEMLIEHPATDTLIEHYLSPMKKSGIDTLILGCTHYPLLEKPLMKFFGPDVTLCSSAGCCALEVEQALKGSDMFSDSTEPVRKFFVSDDLEQFKQHAQAFSTLPIENLGQFTVEPLIVP